MRICVISDIHYKYTAPDAQDRENQVQILSFLKWAVVKYDLMVLNGDIFDLWFDWKYTLIKQYFPLLHRLAAIREGGCRLALVSGNHDFWFGDFLSGYLGVEVYTGDFSLEADGKRMLFTHGDLHTINDLRYKILRRTLRMGWTRGLFSLLHPDLALSVGAWLSRSSRARKISHNLAGRKNAGLYRFASKQLEKNSFDIVCMGHSHKPQLREAGSGFYVNTGDWIVHHSYAEISDGTVELKQYKGDLK